MGLIGRKVSVQPPNLPPEWTATPNPQWQAGVGGTYDLSNDTFDQEGDSLTYTLNGGSAALPTGVSLASNGILTATSAVTEATTAAVLVDIDDGVNSLVTSPSFSIVITAVLATGYPRLGIMAIGGWGGTGMDSSPGGMPGRMSRIAAHDIAVIGTWRTWTYSGTTGPAKDRSNICAYIKSFNANVLLYNYTKPTDVSRGNALNIEPWVTWMDTKADAEKWWLYDGDGFVNAGWDPVTKQPIDPHNVKFASGNFPDAQTNLSSHTSADSAGLRAAEWLAKAFHANSGDSGDWVTSGYGIRSSHGFDGVYQDIMRYEPRTIGDWEQNGGEDARDSATALAAKFDGDNKYHVEWTSLESGFLHCGNYTQNAGVGVALDDYNNAIASGYQNLVHGVFLEQMLGRTSSIESFSTWDRMMLYYKRAMTLNAGMTPQHTFFDNWEVNGFSESDPNIWDATHSLYDWGRYGLCSCLQDDGYYGFPTSGGFVDCNILDEYSFDLGAPLAGPDYDGADVTTSNSGSGYNSYESNVYLREFDNGLAIVNPKSNGTQTITLPSAGAGFHWERLDATAYASQDTTTNDGATVTTQQLPERHGIIIARVAD